MIGGIVDMQPAALPGAYNATFANGQSMLVHGPSAEQLYSRYQANAPQRGLPEGATAQNDANQSAPEPNQSMADAPVRMGTTEVSAPQGGQAEPPPAADEGPHKVPGGAAMSLDRARALKDQQPAPAEDVGVQQARAQVPPAQTPGGQPRIGEPLGYSMKAVDPATGKEVEGPAIMTAEGPRVYVGARAGSPGGLTKIGKEFMGHAGEAEQQIAQARSAEDTAAARGAELAQQQATEEAAFAKEQQKQAEIQYQGQEEENQQIEQHVQDLDSKWHAAREEYNHSKVDSGRLMRGNWLAALGMALGAMGASMGHHANFAAEFVNNNIERDIRAQEKEIEIKKDEANNALLELSKSQGSLAAGKIALKQLLVERTLTHSQSLAASYKAPTLQAAAQQLSASLAEQRAQLDLQRKQSYVDKAYHDRMYYSPGSAGRSAGVLVPTMESMKGRQAGQIAGRELALKEDKAAATAAGGGAIPRGLLQQASSVQSVNHVADKILKTYGVKPGQNVDWSEGVGLGLSKRLTGDTARTLKSELPTLFREQYKVANGNPPTEGAEKEFADQIEHWSDAQIINFANNAKADAAAKAKFIDSQRGKGSPLEMGEESGLTE